MTSSNYQSGFVHLRFWGCTKVDIFKGLEGCKKMIDGDVNGGDSVAKKLDVLRSMVRGRVSGTDDG